MSAMPAKKERENFVVFEANMDAALRRIYRRTGAEMPCIEMPFDDLLRAEDDGICEGEVSDYEWRQRIVGVRALLRFLRQGVRQTDWRAGGSLPSMADVMKQLYVVARALQDEMFSGMTMTEAALMQSETKAAHSWRCKVLSGQIELEGMKGSRLPGQKSKHSTPNYSAAQKGNCNRKGGNAEKKRQAKQRQASFLRKLKIPKQVHESHEKHENTNHHD